MRVAPPVVVIYHQSMKLFGIFIAVLCAAGLCAPSWLSAADMAPDNVVRSTPIGAGDRAPDFTLEDQNSRRHTLSSELKSRPVVLVFYRGHW